MRTIAWREIREYRIWALLYMVVMLVSFAAVLFTERETLHSYGGYRNGFSLVSETFLLTGRIGALLWAATLGFVQILADFRGDRTALLLHRPATRSSIFFGKASGGAVLYFFPLGVPFVLACAWAATPGNLAAPFWPRLMLPAIADMLSGLAFYFAAMIAALRPARWYGSRVLPLIAAAPAVAATHHGSFAIALLWILLITAVFALAAWGAFVRLGMTASQPLASRAALGLILYIGLFITGAVTLYALVPSGPLQPVRQYLMDRKGRVLIAQYDNYTPFPGHLTDLQGGPMEEYADLGSRAKNVIMPPFLWLTDLFGKDYRRFGPAHPAWGVDKIWYFDDVRRLFLGYSARHRRFLGTLGPDGFAPAGTVNKPFDDAPLNAYLYGSDLHVFPHAVYRADYGTARITAVFLSPDVQILAAQTSRVHPETNMSQTVTVLTETEILSVKPDGIVLFRTPLVHDWRAYIQIALFQADRKHVVWYKPFSRTPELLTEIADDGTRHEIKLPPLDQTHHTHSPLLGVMPPAIQAAVTLEFLDGSTGMFALMAFSVMASLAATITIVIARRYAFSRGAIWTWALLALLLGPLGVLLLVAMREWPVREACAGCGKRRVVTRSACERCGAAWPAPAKDGTEILEPATATSSSPG